MKQRVFAFLLRRLLGPLLDEKSLEKLRQSLDVSLQDGRLILTNVCLNAHSINRRFEKHTSSPIQLRSATLKRLEIQLSILETDESAAGSSLTWRAMKMVNVASSINASSETKPSVQLFCEVQMDGLHIEVEPAQNSAQDEPTDAVASEAAGGFWSRYVDAVMSSLRLSLQLSNVSMRLTCPYTDKRDVWIECSAIKLCYHDMLGQMSRKTKHKSARDHGDRTIFHKALDVVKFSIAIGESSWDSPEGPIENESSSIQQSIGYVSDLRMPLAMLEDVQLKVLATQHRHEDQVIEIRNDVRLNMAQRMHVTLNADVVRRVHQVLELLAEKTEHVREHLNQQSPSVDVLEEYCEDEAAISVVASFAKQYNEARMLVDQNFFRGGILLPADEINGDALSFDAFFDANESGLGHFSSVLMESIAPAGDRNQDTRDRLMTKFRLDVPDLSLKLLFNGPDDFGYVRHSEEYLLMTISDLNVIASMATSTCDVCLTIVHIDAEHSQAFVAQQSTNEYLSRASVRRVEISEILRFKRGHADVIVQPPCLSVSLSIDTLSIVEIECMAEPIELTYEPETVSALVHFFGSISASQLSRPQTMSSQATESILSRNLTISAACPSITLIQPIPDDRDWSTLFRRCSYVNYISLQRHGAIGLSIYSAVFKLNSDDGQPFCCVTLNQINAHVLARRSADDDAALCFDVFSLSSHDELDLNPLCIKVWQNDKRQDSNRCSELFPRTPAVSSFKARQQDDDEDNRIDRVLFSETKGVPLATRRDLRGRDVQSDMIAATSRSDILIEIDIPNCAGDLTTTELMVLKSILDSVIAVGQTKCHAEVKTDTDPAYADKVSFCVSIHCDNASFALHASHPQSKCDDYLLDSILVNFCIVKIHSLHQAERFIHARVLAEEIDWFDSTNSRSSSQGEFLGLRSPSPLARSLSYGHCLSKASVNPVFHRSHLFQPISRQSPAIAIDIVNNSKKCRRQHNLNITIYDSTIRYAQDEVFAERLLNIINGIAEVTKQGSFTTPKSDRVTRAFLSFADCNIDYSSSSKLKTKSRMIVRIGDLRISSNMVSPRPAKQAFSLTLGDVALYLCKQRHSYNFENAQIPRNAIYLQRNQLDCEAGLTSVRALDLLGCINVATIDSFDAVVTFARDEPIRAIDAYMQANLTIGELSVYVCKDSFDRLFATLSELTTELSALNAKALDDLRECSYPECAGTGRIKPLSKSSSSSKQIVGALDKTNLDGSSVVRDFFLDGYDWTTVDQAESGLDMSAGEEQSSRWYDEIRSDSTSASPNNSLTRAFNTSDSRAPPMQQSPRIMTDHFPPQTASDPPHDAVDFGIGALIDTATTKAQLNHRIIIHDFTLRVRMFDGFDWPDLVDKRQRRSGTKGKFIIDDTARLSPEENFEIDDELALPSKTTAMDLKHKLVGDLLLGAPDTQSGLFKGTLLPDEKSQVLIQQAEKRRLGRKSANFFQFALSGVSGRFESLCKSKVHRLASCVNVTVQDFFAAETISGCRPVKMVGEWLSDADHPRETAEGLFTMKLITWHPKARVMLNNKIANDECEAVIKILPLRCTLDQRAIRFVRIFVRQDSDDNDYSTNAEEEQYWLPPSMFTSFRFEPFKLKIDYRPEKFDTDAIRNGAIVELINLSPIDSMVLTLQMVNISDTIGFGNVLSSAARSWIDDVCSTQLVKFLTNSRPLEPFKTVGLGVSDLIVLPLEAFQNGESVKKALRAGAKSLSKAVIYEAFTVTSRATEFIADQISRLSVSSIGSNTLPSRPLMAPRGVLDTTPHVVESITRGLQAANYKILVVPYREYRRSGTKGAVTSVIRGILVAIAAPASGAVEALSYGMIGARNQLAPEIRKEEEANQRGLHWER
ncbi:hypothetical protein MPSEU_000478400 [Mayamaea pseudoterrestris]|nr:hypothetical protein MPSEU_000478400 [Mayamaea pseudoterrestris]